MTPPWPAGPEWRLWAQGMRPHHRPTRGEMWAAAVLLPQHERREWGRIVDQAADKLAQTLEAVVMACRI